MDGEGKVEISGAENMEDKLLDVRDLKVSFYSDKGSVQVVRGFDISMKKGEIVGILGESGSGKTVSSSSIIKLVDESLGSIDSGEAIFKGRDLLKLSEKDLKRIRGDEISYIFQNSSAALSPYKRIGKQLGEVLKTHGRVVSKEHILKTLEEVGLEDGERIYHMYPFQLSGGQNQRIMIAQCILCDPELLIADEPTSSIDASLQKTILDLLKDISIRNKMSVIIITHDFGVARYLCDRLMVMYGGLVLEEGTIEEMLNSPLHPYTQELIRCARSLAEDDETMYTIEGAPPTPYQFRDECPFYSRCSLREGACREGIPQKIDLDGRRVRCIRYEKR